MHQQRVEALRVAPLPDHLRVRRQKCFMVFHQVGEFGIAEWLERGVAVGGGSDHAVPDLHIFRLFGVFQHLAENHQVHGILQKSRREGLRHAELDIFEHVPEVVECDAPVQEPREIERLAATDDHGDEADDDHIARGGESVILELVLAAGVVRGLVDEEHGHTEQIDRADGHRDGEFVRAFVAELLEFVAGEKRHGGGGVIRHDRVCGLLLR